MKVTRPLHLYTFISISSPVFSVMKRTVANTTDLLQYTYISCFPLCNVMCLTQKHIYSIRFSEYYLTF
jgi:hypothetical protein